MKKAVVSILLCLVGTGIWAMEKVQFDTVSFEPEHATGYYPLAMPVTPSTTTDYVLDIGSGWHISTDHPFIFAIKKTDNPSHDPEFCLLVNINDHTYAMPVSFANELPNDNKVKSVAEAKIVTITKIDAGTSTEQPEIREIATSTDNPIIVDAGTTKSLSSTRRILPYVLSMPIVGFAIYGGYEAMQKAKAWYAKNPNFFQEKRAQFLQKIKQLRQTKTAV